MYCKHCGKEVDDNSLYCSLCGGNLGADSNANSTGDKPSAGFAVLGFFIPLAGLILYLIYEHSKPQMAKSAGKGAIIGFITEMALGVLAVVICAIFMSTFIGSFM